MSDNQAPPMNNPFKAETAHTPSPSKSKQNSTHKSLVIRKKKRREHAHHQHGGWKVAYADFVTALMTFFLLMWIVNVTTEEQRKGLVDYFNPDKDPITITVPMTDGDTKGLDLISIFEKTALNSQPETQEENTSTEGGIDVDIDPEKAKEYEDELKRFIEESEQLKLIGERIKSTIAEDPTLSGLSENILIEEVSEGLRIQVIDKGEFSMFKVGSSSINEEARQLLMEIGKIIKPVSNKIAVSGHTDGRPYVSKNKYSNWELSADRANAARREFMESGIDSSRFSRIEGRADTEHLIPEDPLDPRNRRISVLILREYNIKPKDSASESE